MMAHLPPAARLRRIRPSKGYPRHALLNPGDRPLHRARAARGAAVRGRGTRVREATRRRASPTSPQSCCRRWSTFPPPPRSRRRTARPAAADAAIPARLAVREVLPRLHEPQSPRRRARRGAAADAEPRLGLHRRSVGHHRHQQPRDRRRRQDHRHLAGQHQPDRDIARQGRQGRSRSAEGATPTSRCRRSSGAIPITPASATGCSRSATRSASAARSRPGS